MPTAFVDFQGNFRSIIGQSKAAGEKAGGQFSEQFTRDVNGKLRNSKGQFVKSGEAIGGGIDAGAKKGFKGFGWLKRDASKAGSAAGKDAGKRFSAGMSPSFAGLAKGFVGAFAAVKVVSLFGDTIEEARDAAKVTRITEAVIKSTGGAANISADQMGKLAESLSVKAGVDDEVIQSGANVLATFTKVRNEAGAGNDIFNQTTAAALDMSAALGTDMQGASLQLGKALNDPIKGISALGRAGVSFTQQQKDQIKVLVESGDTLSAQKIILGEMETQFGGAAEAAADPMAKLEVVVGNLKERVGTALLPIIERAADWLGRVLPGALDWAGNAFGVLRERLAPVVAVIRDGLGAALSWLTGTAIPAIKGAWSDLTTSFTTGENAGGIFGAIGEKAGAFVGWITGDAIPAIKGAWSDLTTSFSTGENAGGIFGPIGEKARAFIDWITLTAIPAIKGAWEDLTSSFSTGENQGGIFGSIGEKARQVYDWVVLTAIPGIKDAVGSFMAGLKGQGGEGSFFTDLGNAIRTVADWIQITLIPAAGRLWGALQPVFNWIKDNAGPILIGIGILFAALVSPIGLAIGAFVWAYQKFDWFRTGVATILGLIRGYFENIWLPVFVFMWNTASTFIGLVIGYFKTILWPVIQTVIGWIVAYIQNVWLPIFRVVWSVVSTVFTSVVGAIRAAWGFIRPILAAVVAFIRDQVMVRFEMFKTVAATVFSAVRTAISAAWEFIRPKLAAVVGFIRDQLMVRFNLFKTTAETVFNAVRTAISAAWEFIRPKLAAIVGFIRDQLMARFELFKTTAETVWGAIRTAISSAWDFIRPKFDAIVAFVRETLIPIWDKISGAVGRAFDRVPEIIRGALNTAGGVIAGFLKGAAGIADLLQLPDSIGEGLRGAAEAAAKWGGSAPPVRGDRYNMRAAGGPITGGVPGKDSVPAMLTPGEVVIRKASVDKYGLGNLLALNDGRIPGFAGGGLIGNMIYEGNNPDWWRSTGRPSAAAGLAKLTDKAANLLRNTKAYISEGRFRDLPWATRVWNPEYGMNYEKNSRVAGGYSQRTNSVGLAVGAGAGTGKTVSELLLHEFGHAIDVAIPNDGMLARTWGQFAYQGGRSGAMVPGQEDARAWVMATPAYSTPMEGFAEGFATWSEGGLPSKARVYYDHLFGDPKPAAGGGGESLLDRAKGVVGSVKDKVSELVGLARSIAGGALDRLLPRLPVAPGILGVGGAAGNKIRDGVVEMLRGKASSIVADDAAAREPRGGGPQGGGLPGSTTGLNPEFLGRFNAYSSAVGGLSIVSGFRSREQQAYLYDRWLRRVPGQAQAAPPGRSQHEVGLAIDHAPRSTAAMRDVARGFRLTYPMSFEPWHVQPFHKGGEVKLHPTSFDGGGTLKPGWNMVRNDLGRDEPVAPSGGTIVLDQPIVLDGSVIGRNKKVYAGLSAQAATNRRGRV